MSKNRRTKPWVAKAFASIITCPRGCVSENSPPASQRSYAAMIASLSIHCGDRVWNFSVFPYGTQKRHAEVRDAINANAFKTTRCLPFRDAWTLLDTRTTRWIGITRFRFLLLRLLERWRMLLRGVPISGEIDLAMHRINYSPTVSQLFRGIQV